MYWKEYKSKLDNISNDLYEIYVGCMLGDATLRVRGDKSSIKFEQGYKNRDYLYHLFDISKKYVFSEEPMKRYEIRIGDYGHDTLSVTTATIPYR